MAASSTPHAERGQSRDSPRFTIEVHQQHDPNVVSFQLALRRWRWFVVGCYLALDDTSTIECIVTAIGHRPHGAALLVAGDFNVDLTAPEGNVQDKEITTAIATSGMEDMSAHFLPHQKYWAQDGRTWSMHWLGRGVRSRADYLLGTDRHLFRNISARDPRYNTDHYTILGCLRSATLREHTQYLRRRKWSPLCLPGAPTREEQLFADLRQAIPKPPVREQRHNSWISAAMWRLINMIVSVHRETDRDQRRLHGLGRQIRASLQEDRCCRAESAGTAIDPPLASEPPLVKEA